MPKISSVFLSLTSRLSNTINQFIYIIIKGARTVTFKIVPLRASNALLRVLNGLMHRIFVHTIKKYIKKENGRSAHNTAQKSLMRLFNIIALKVWINREIFFFFSWYARVVIILLPVIRSVVSSSLYRCAFLWSNGYNNIL